MRIDQQCSKVKLFKPKFPGNPFITKMAMPTFIGALAIVFLLAVPTLSHSQTLEEANTLESKVLELYTAGKYEEAIPFAQHSLVIRENILGLNHDQVAESLNDLAALYKKIGRSADAEQLYKRAVAIEEKVLNPDDPRHAKTLHNLALLYEDQGRYADAERLYSRSLAIYEKAFGSDHPDVAAQLNDLADVYKAQGRHADAERLYRRSLAIREKTLGRDHPHIALSLAGLASLYEDQARYDEVESLYKRAIDILAKHSDYDSEVNLSSALNNLAEFYETSARYQDAERLYRRSLILLQKTVGSDHSKVGITLDNLANMYADQGRYADALQSSKRALAILEKSFGQEHEDVAIALRNLAHLYMRQEDYVDAEPLLRRSLAISEKALGTNSPSVAKTINSLASIFAKQGRRADAERMYKRSLEILRQTTGAESLQTAETLNSLGMFYKDQGRFADAELLYKRVLAIDEKTFGLTHPNTANSLNNLAGLYSDQHRYRIAEEMYKRAFAIWEQTLGAAHPNSVRALTDLAGTYADQGRYFDALPLIRRTITQNAPDKAFAFPIIFGSSRRNVIARSEGIRDSYRVLQLTSSSVAGESISKLAVRLAAGSGDLAQLIRKDQDLANEAERLDRFIMAAVSKLPSERDTAKEKEIRNRIELIESERKKLKATLADRFPTYLALSSPGPLGLKETQSLLANEEALVAFDFDEASYAWVITRNNSSWTEVKLTATQLTERVRRLRISVDSGSKEAFDTWGAFQLYQQLFGSIANDLRGKTRLSIVANGALTSLPFHLLVTKDPRRKGYKRVDWLVRSYAVTILPSIQSLKILRTRSPLSLATKPIIAFADPKFANNALPRLPGTRVEVEAIAKSLNADPSDVKLGPKATVTAVKQVKLDQYRIVYFATHGLVSGDLIYLSQSNAEPALALSSPTEPTDYDDGFLKASEVAELKLNADWAVLSACNTAAGDKPGAEALSGLARAFFYAGAKSLIVSHWSVNDQATARLMIGTFYASKHDPSLSRSEALQASMLSMIESVTSDEDAHPRFWSPFVVVGEPAKGR
jgi:CHAT domain-containing protein/Tfp pilus assembly protein PilF